MFEYVWKGEEACVCLCACACVCVCVCVCVCAGACGAVKRAAAGLLMPWCHADLARVGVVGCRKP